MSFVYSTFSGLMCCVCVVSMFYLCFGVIFVCASSVLVSCVGFCVCEEERVKPDLDSSDSPCDGVLVCWTREFDSTDTSKLTRRLISESLTPLVVVQDQRDRHQLICYCIFIGITTNT